MRRDLERRLARLEAAASAQARYRQALRASVKVCALIRERLLLMGIDPALAVSLRRGEEAAAALAAIPDSEELRMADDALTRVAVDDSGCARVETKIEQMAVMFCDEDQPDFARASVAELLAYCVAMEKMAWGD